MPTKSAHCHRQQKTHFEFKCPCADWLQLFTQLLKSNSFSFHKVGASTAAMTSFSPNLCWTRIYTSHNMLANTIQRVGKCWPTSCTTCWPTLSCCVKPPLGVSGSLSDWKQGVSGPPSFFAWSCANKNGTLQTIDLHWALGRDWSRGKRWPRHSSASCSGLAWQMLCSVWSTARFAPGLSMIFVSHMYNGSCRLS